MGSFKNLANKFNRMNFNMDNLSYSSWLSKNNKDV